VPSFITTPIAVVGRVGQLVKHLIANLNLKVFQFCALAGTLRAIPVKNKVTVVLWSKRDGSERRESERDLQSKAITQPI
jgi:hypothetical protein